MRVVDVVPGLVVRVVTDLVRLVEAVAREVTDEAVVRMLADGEVAYVVGVRLGANVVEGVVRMVLKVVEVRVVADVVVVMLGTDVANVEEVVVRIGMDLMADVVKVVRIEADLVVDVVRM
jgi:hypothetical protein